MSLDDHESKNTKVGRYVKRMKGEVAIQLRKNVETVIYVSK